MSAITHGRCAHRRRCGLPARRRHRLQHARQRARLRSARSRARSSRRTAPVLTLNERSNADLFWACRGGGGGNFGINTDVRACRPFGNRAGDRFRARMERRAAPGSGLRRADAGARRRAGHARLARLVGGGHAGPTAPPARTSMKLASARPASRSRHAAGAGAHLLRAGLCAHVTGQEIEVKSSATGTDSDFLEEPDPPTMFQERSTFIAQYARRATPSARSRSIICAAGRGPAAARRADLRFLPDRRQDQRALRRTRPPSSIATRRFIMDVGLDWRAQDTPGSVARTNLRLAGRRSIRRCCRSRTGGAYQNFIDPSLTDWQDAYYGSQSRAAEAASSAAVDPGQRVPLRSGHPVRLNDFASQRVASPRHRASIRLRVGYPDARMRPTLLDPAVRRAHEPAGRRAEARQAFAPAARPRRRRAPDRSAVPPADRHDRPPRAAEAARRGARHRRHRRGDGRPPPAATAAPAARALPDLCKRRHRRPHPDLLQRAQGLSWRSCCRSASGATSRARSRSTTACCRWCIPTAWSRRPTSPSCRWSSRSIR